MENGKALVDAEVVDPDLETDPDAGGLVGSPQEQTIESQLALAENIGKLIDAQNKIRMALLGLAQPGDWVLFKGGDGDGKAEIGFAGSMRIGSTLGVSFTDFEARKETGTDENGAWYRWEVECTAHFKGRQVRVYGRAGSRDKFFGKVRGEYRPLHEIDEGNIKIAARRSAMKEGVKVMFGLHHLDPVFLTQNGVKLANAGGYEFKNQEQKADGAEAVKDTIEAAWPEKEGKTANGKAWKLYKIKTSSGKEYGTFSDTVFNLALDAVVSKKKMLLTLEKTPKGNMQVSAISEAK